MNYDDRTISELKNESDYNVGADFWRYKIGANVIPADTRNKKPSVEWSKFQDEPVPEELHNKWKSNGDFCKGIAVILGRIFHRKDRVGYYLACVDADNQKAITELCTRNGTTIMLQGFAEKTLVEQHKDDPDKAHFYYYSPRPLAKKSSDAAILGDKIAANSIPAFEVKSLGEHGIMYCSPSIHKDGHPYEILGMHEPAALSISEANELERHVDDICRKHGIQYLENGCKTLTPMVGLFKEDSVIHEGHNRHEAVLRVAESLMKRNCGILTLDQIKSMVIEWNERHCVPPLDQTEVDRQWRDATAFIAKKNTQSSVAAGANQLLEQHQINNEDKSTSSSEKMAFLVEELMKAYTFKTLRDTETVLHYREGKYHYGGELVIKAELEKLGGYSITTHLRTEVINHIKARTLVDRSEFDRDLDILNVKNGLVNIRTGEFKVHDPNYLSLVQLPVVYNPKARPKRIVDFMYNVLDASDVPLMLEYMPYQD